MCFNITLDNRTILFYNEFADLSRLDSILSNSVEIWG